MQKRMGQAAVEYLMTYGWAIAALVIIIAILAFYSTSFSPTIPEQCIFPKQVICNGFFVSAKKTGSGIEENIIINLTNNFGHKINITNITIFHEGGYLIINNNEINNNGLIEADSPFLISKTGKLNISARDIVSMKIIIYYSPCIENNCNNDGFSIQGSIIARLNRLN
ncbi:MAG: hypothetical protein QXI89_00645 [Candidatus Anstonellales archaeon]